MCTGRREPKERPRVQLRIVLNSGGLKILLTVALPRPTGVLQREYYDHNQSSLGSLDREVLGRRSILPWIDWCLPSFPQALPESILYFHYNRSPPRRPQRAAITSTSLDCRSSEKLQNYRGAGSNCSPVARTKPAPQSLS
jgi:hypothetical protein